MQAPPPPVVPDEPRRGFLSASSVFMLSGLAAGYGVLGLIAGRFLYPARAARTRWMFVARASDLEVGDSRTFRAPSGDVVTIARRTNNGNVDDFVALSSTCPHLGCKVHWEPQNERFFCPCHNGIFRPDGKATGGPPAEAGQSLLSYPLNVENGLLYIEVQAESLVARAGVIPEPEGPPGPGHDPCLFARVDGKGPTEHCA